MFIAHSVSAGNAFKSADFHTQYCVKLEVHCLTPVPESKKTSRLFVLFKLTLKAYSA